MLMPTSCLNVQLGKCSKLRKCLSMEMFPYIDRKWRYWLTWMKNHSLGSQASMIVGCYFQMQGPRPQGSNTLERRWGSLSVLWEFTECSLRVHWAFKECSLSVIWAFSECSLRVRWAFKECFLSVLWGFSEWSLIYLWVISEWSLSDILRCPVCALSYPEL